MFYFPDGNCLACLCDDNIVRVWDVKSCKERLEIKSLNGKPTCVAFSPDGKFLAVGTCGLYRVEKSSAEPREVGKLELRDASTGSLYRTLEGHDGSVTSIEFMRTQPILCSAGLDRTLRLWNCATGTEVASFKGHDDPIECLAISPDDKFVVTGDWEGGIGVWNVGDSKQVAFLNDHLSCVTALCFSSDGSKLVSGSGDQEIRVWDMVGIMRKAKE
jgi:WD40 repeat protein